MGEAFRLGGWGMYPTAISGLVLVYCALRYAAAPDAGRALLVRRLQLLTFMVGCLGFTVGVIKSFVAASASTEGDIAKLVVGGVGESLNNVGLALVTMVIAGIATAIGTTRAGAKGAELTDPHV